jgi:ubiquinone/menaquinone biosynthesis C-methylase UbiE
MRFLNPKRCVSFVSLSEGAVVADFGSGVGEFAICAAEQVGNTGTVYAIDIQKEIVHSLGSRAEEEGFGNLRVIWGNVEEEGGSKIADNLCDFVIISNLMFQSDHKEGIIQEARRVLKEGGELLVIDWTESHGGLGPREDHVFGRDDAMNLLLKHNFVFAGDVPAGDYHYGLLFKKQ